ncbi:hypothetical protein GE061_016494 [Apolygus lucorum]|uniref:Uncharacterized protein n=1 Tax=Apolygus lucorum TaxID=248454 RepID=A0A6A4K1T8_APOLU|nr:hypothetical protein GE061_016494 [Apolygus lucorum]
MITLIVPTEESDWRLHGSSRTNVSVLWVMSHKETSFSASGDAFIESPVTSQDDQDDDTVTDSEISVNEVDWPMSSNYHLTEEAFSTISVNYLKNMIYVLRSLSISVTNDG